MNYDTESTTNTLRLSQTELHKLLDYIEQNKAEDRDPDREYVRWTFRTNIVHLTVQHQSGSKVTLPVPTRNISRGGVSILHSAYIHANSPCTVQINLPGQEQQTIKGKIVRCSHLVGRIHEIGIAFDELISTKNMLGLDPLHEAYSLERVDPDRLHGSVLIATESDLDRDLLLMFLEDTSLMINTADTLENIISRVKKGCDLIVLDFNFGEITAVEVIKELHQSGVDVPVLVMTPNKSEKTMDAITEADASGVLSKPVTKERLLQALAEFLHADGDGGPLHSGLTQTDSAYPLLAKFLSSVPRMALDLEKALRENDEETCTKICRTLCGTATPLGFPTISVLAIAAEKKLSVGNFKDASNDIRSIIVACRRIKSKPAA